MITYTPANELKIGMALGYMGLLTITAIRKVTNGDIYFNTECLGYAGRVRRVSARALIRVKISDNK